MWVLWFGLALVSTAVLWAFGDTDLVLSRVRDREVREVSSSRTHGGMHMSEFVMPGSQLYPILNAYPSCQRNGCMASTIKEMEAEAQETLDKIRRKGMEGQALWCDVGDHAFSAKDTQRETWKYQTHDEEGNEIDETMVACSQHGRRKTFRRSDQRQHIAALESELGIGDTSG